MRPLLLALIGLLPSLASATDVQGTLSGHTVWTKSGSPYHLTGDVTVGWGAKLTLEPGVEVIASTEDGLRSGVDPHRVELIVDGALVVRGTPGRPVTFTSPGGSGSWYGIRVRGGRGTVIDGAVITQARRGVSLGMSAVVRNSSISDSSEDCLNVSWGTTTLEGNQLRACGMSQLHVGKQGQVHQKSPQDPGHGLLARARVRGERIFIPTPSAVPAQDAVLVASRSQPDPKAPGSLSSLVPDARSRAEALPVELLRARRRTPLRLIRTASSSPQLEDPALAPDSRPPEGPRGPSPSQAPPPGAWPETLTRAPPPPGTRNGEPDV